MVLALCRSCTDSTASDLSCSKSDLNLSFVLRVPLKAGKLFANCLLSAPIHFFGLTSHVTSPRLAGGGGRYSPICHRGNLVSLLGQSMRDLWWKKIDARKVSYSVPLPQSPSPQGTIWPMFQIYLFNSNAI